MVRASPNNSQTDDKKETTNKKSAKKKSVTIGIWPCKINGCNKQFAREADLKRHQRTTKLHSMPGFSCPQCDATFTRTDALRRHQKSRHDGIIIEPPDQNSKDHDDDGSSGSQSGSRSGTPPPTGRARVSVTQPQPSPQPPRGPSSYYRAHTLTTTPSPYMRRPPTIPSQYAQISLPPSATRMNIAAGWGYPQPWTDGPPQPINYQHMYYSPYYRHNGSICHPPEQSPPAAANSNQNPCSFQTSPSSTSILKISAPSNTGQSDNSSILPSDTPIPAIDPSLNPTDSTELTEEQVLEITQAAVKAVLEAEAERCNARSRTGSAPTQAICSYSELGKLDSRPNDFPDDLNSNCLRGFERPLCRPDPMEHILTEDGEPMLNPAELLTQESLASPPPSQHN